MWGLAPQITPTQRVNSLVLRRQDGYRTTLLLNDLLADDVLLADRLNSEPSPLAHGASAMGVQAHDRPGGGEVRQGLGRTPLSLHDHLVWVGRFHGR